MMETLSLRQQHQPCSPHLKKVLKSYQLTAGSSLSGPRKVLGSADCNLVRVAGDDLVSCKAVTSPAPPPSLSLRQPEHETYVTPPPPPFPIQQVPILAAADQSRSERCETLLEGEIISCFVVGGEKRLCLPQILNSVLRDFSLAQINQVCDELHIFCSRCHPDQLEVLKVTGVLPMTAPSCGLITKTDAERVCSTLLQRHGVPAMQPAALKANVDGFKVVHKCFGKAQGILYPDLYKNPMAQCVECEECRQRFTPEKFVVHVHKALETRTCHWGFDSSNWRSYLLVDRARYPQEEWDKLDAAMEDVKDRFTGRFSNGTATEQPGKRKVDLSDVYTSREEVVLKKVKYDEVYYIPPVAGHSLVYTADSCGAYWYAPHWAGPSKLPAVKEAIAKNHVPSYKESVPQLPSSLSHSPPVLLHPERVVPMSESERFERSYQPNVALAPPSLQSKSTVSNGRVNGQLKPLVTKLKTAAYNPEIELSSDTDETSSDLNGEENARTFDISEEVEPLMEKIPAELKEQFVSVFARLQTILDASQRSKEEVLDSFTECQQGRRQDQRELAHEREVNRQLHHELESLKQLRSQEQQTMQAAISALEMENHALRRELKMYRKSNKSHVSVITSPVTSIKLEPANSPE